MAIGLSDTVRSTRATDIVTLAGVNAYIRIYSGTRPAKNGTATTLLAELRGNASQFGTVSNGVLTMSAITGDSLADNSGTATWFRILSSASVFVMDGDVGVSGSDLNLVTTTIVANQPVNITSAVFTEAN